MRCSHCRYRSYLRWTNKPHSQIASTKPLRREGLLPELWRLS